MKEFIEEYGGLIVAAVCGMMILSLLFGLFGWNGDYFLKELLESFLRGNGAVVS